MSRRSIEYFIELSIQQMWSHLHRPITLADLARTAMLSRYHFCRTFRRVTGISPTQFLSALRIQEAKNLLDMTDLSVTEISVRVGYSSMSTFCTRFAACVGFTPTMYRRIGNSPIEIPAHHAAIASAPASAARLHGRLLAPAGFHVTGPIFVGLFPERIAQGRPLRHAVLERLDRFELTQVPSGRWHLLCHAQADDGAGQRFGGDRMIAAVGPLTVRPNTNAELSIRLRPATLTDPPALLALSRPIDARVRPAAPEHDAGPRAAASSRTDYASL